jgi:peptidoglycan/LPS O-acetylase OafA/YrhL
MISVGNVQNALLDRLEGHDYSYGLYLYGFLTQQCVVHFFGAQSPLFNALVSLPITAILAFLSWNAIERKALGLKPDRSSVKRRSQDMQAEA